MTSVNRKRLTASRVAQFNTCHAASDLEAAIPGFKFPVVDPNAGAKGRGTLMHEILEQVAELTHQEIAGLGKAMLYLAELKQGKRFNVLAEHEILAEWLPSKPKVIVDLVLFTQSELHIIDWKTGRIKIDAFGNEQLLYYAATYFELAPKAKTISLHIVQPWADNIDVWEVTREEVREFMEKVRATEAALNAGSLTFGVSDHCKFCPANPHSRGDKGYPFCPAMMQLHYPLGEDTESILDL